MTKQNYCEVLDATSQRMIVNYQSNAGMASSMSGRTCSRITHSWADFRRWAVEHYRLVKHIFFVVCRPNI
jgi:hypothetical protein